MVFLSRLRSLWRNTVHRERVDRELDDEVRAVFDLLVDEHMRAGLGRDEARRAATIAIGRMESITGQVREVRAGALWAATLQDLRHGIRLLWRNRLFTLTGALSVAVCIAANTAVFSIVNRLLFREAALVEDARRLVEIAPTRGDGSYAEPMMPYQRYTAVRDGVRSLDGVYGFQLDLTATSLRGRTAAERIFSTTVTNTYFPVLGIRPAIGRLFGPYDSEEPGASPIVVLSHAFWTRRFNANPAMLGQTLHINGQPVTVVGVTPAGFQGLSLAVADVWLPIGAARTLDARNGQRVAVGGRLKAGVSVREAAAEVETLGRTLQREEPRLPAFAGGPREDGVAGSLRLMAAGPLPAIVRGLASGLLALLMAIVSIVLFVGCANIAGVLLARGAARRHEIAVRLAVGAGRARLVRQLLTETVLLFALGGIAGVVLARALTSAIVAALPALPVPVDTGLPLDQRVIAFTATVSLAAALLSGLIPALQASRADVVSALKTEPQGASPRQRLRAVFLVVQVAFSILLVIAAGLLVRALQRSGSAELGFDATGVEVATLDLSIGHTKETGPPFVRGVLDRLRSTPGVSSASATMMLPLGGQIRMCCGVEVPGATPPAGETVFQPAWNVIEPAYFTTLRIPLRAGRDFADIDRPGAPSVTIVSEAAARRFWPGDAIGKHVIWRRMPPLIARTPGGSAVPTFSPVRLTVVGVAADISASGRTSLPLLYLPLAQQPELQVSLLARSSTGRRLTSELRDAVTGANPNVPVLSEFRLTDQASPVLTQLRVSAAICAGVGTVALFLAAIGIYGVTAYGVRQRTREIGIRMAMGAQRSDVVRLVLRQGMSLVLMGSVIGLLLAAASSRLLVRLLFGVPPLDALTFGGAAMLFAAVGLAACYLPVRRATRVSAVEALRHD